MATNLLAGKWPDLDRTELRLLLHEVVGGPGQFMNRAANPNRFHLPLAGPSCRVTLVFDKAGTLDAIEPGPAFDAAQWEQIAEEIDSSLLAGPRKVGREFSFCGHRVVGSWRGPKSGVQIVPPPDDAPRAPVELAQHPFILEFPLTETRRWPVTNYRRKRDHRNLTLLLNVLLNTRMSLMTERAPHFWAVLSNADGSHRTEWLQQSFFANLGPPVQDQLSPAAPTSIQTFNPEQYADIIGIDGLPLRLPDNLDESICAYRALSRDNRAKFDRAAFWLDISRANWETSVSVTFAALVSAIEALTERGESHSFVCPVCKQKGTHEPMGATKRFLQFLKAHASKKQLGRMYGLRSDILHGTDLMLIDQGRDFGWGPPSSEEMDMVRELWSAATAAIRNWLRNPCPASVTEILTECVP
jgi:hypothetical protein